MAYTNKSMEDYRVASILAIENSQIVEEIQVALLGIGYHAIRIQEGVDLHGFFASSIQGQVSARQQQYSKTMGALTAFNIAFSVYIGLVNLFRTTFENERDLMEELGLFGDRERSASGFITQSTHFYNTLLQKDKIFNRIVKFQITKEILQADLNLVHDFEIANREKIAAIGAFQRATKVRDDAYRALRHWMREFEKSCRIVLKDKPQLCEQLGFRELSDIIKNRKKPTVPPTPEQPPAAQATQVQNNQAGATNQGA